jgi:hypothetical protein
MNIYRWDMVHLDRARPILLSMAARTCTGRLLLKFLIWHIWRGNGTLKLLCRTNIVDERRVLVGRRVICRIKRVIASLVTASHDNHGRSFGLV